MPKINITAADLLKTKSLDVGWYPCTIVKVHPLIPSAKGDSSNQNIDTLIEGTNGKEITMRFNSKLWGMIDPLWKAAMGKPVEAGQVDTDELMGKKFDGYVEQKLVDGILYDNITKFLPLGTGKSQKAPF